MSINVLRKTDNEGAIRAAIEFSDLLPPPGYSFESTNENVEIAHLKRTLKWKDPRGLFAYSSYIPSTKIFGFGLITETKIRPSTS